MSYARFRKPSYRIAIAWIALLTLAGPMLTAAANAQAFTTLKTLGLTSDTGSRPQCPLVQGPDGTLYGTTYSGEAGVSGTVFKVLPDGSGFTVLKWFTNSVEDGAFPGAGLTLAGDTLYGTAYWGGGTNHGTVFRMNIDGTGFTVLHYFNNYIAGEVPVAGVTLSGNTLYGTTQGGGVLGYGTLFKVNIDGTGHTVLRHFNGDDGKEPSGDLTVSGNVLYGTTFSGGSARCGTIFKLNTDDTGFTVLKEFGRLGGRYPAAGLILSGGVMYGTTSGDPPNYGVVFKMNIDGTGYTQLKQFGYSEGNRPSGRLALNGNTLYGTTSWGGDSNHGTVYQLNTDGTGYAIIKHFTGSDGRRPLGGLIASGNTLYGTTYYGGSFDLGTVFKIELPIPLTIQPVESTVVLSWTDAAFALQASTEVNGVYTNIPGAVSPSTNPATGPQQFYRLKKD